ncbi:hypothetical protein OAE37_01055 [Pirellulaceae bacterium]|jgi:hypothetical protein|nr:hypothetical protein [Pirellulaceae bacterium]
MSRKTSSQHIAYTSRREEPLYIGFEEEAKTKQKKQSNGFGTAATFFGFLGLLTSVVTIPFLISTMYTNGYLDRPPISVQLAAPFFFVFFAALAVIFGAIGIFRKPRFLAFVGGLMGLLVIAGAMGWTRHVVHNHEQDQLRMENRVSRNQTERKLESAKKTIEKFRAENGEFPDGLAGNRLTIETKDSWQTELRYELVENGFTIRSAGPDKKFESDDDIVRTTFVKEIYTTVKN